MGAIISWEFYVFFDWSRGNNIKCFNDFATIGGTEAKPGRYNPLTMFSTLFGHQMVEIT